MPITVPGNGNPSEEGKGGRNLLYAQYNRQRNFIN